MANTAISALPTVTTPLAGTEVLPIVQSSSTKRVTISQIASYIGSYTLPTASASVLGGIKVGTGLSIDGSSILSVTGLTSTSYTGQSINLTIKPAQQTGAQSGGTLYLQGADVTNASANTYSGRVYISGGATSAGIATGGPITIIGGSSTNTVGGSINITGGQGGDVANGGSVIITSGADGGNGGSTGDITLTVNGGTIGSGNLYLTNVNTNGTSYVRLTSGGLINIASAVAGSINNMTVGITTPLAAKFTTITATGNVTLSSTLTAGGGVGTNGQVLTSTASGVQWSTVSSGASATTTIQNKSAAYTVVAGDLGTIINCTSGTFTVSLTAAATLGAGFTVTIWNTSTTSTDAITIDPNGSETIDGKTTRILRRGEGMQIVCDGTNWQSGSKKAMLLYAENMDPVNSTLPQAIGDRAFAIGPNNTANGIYSSVIGYNNTANGTADFVAGTSSSTGSGGYAIAINGNANSGNSTAIGHNSGVNRAIAAGSGAVALGGSYASGNDSFAAGIGNNSSSYGAKNTNAVALGNSAVVTGLWAVAIGYLASASGNVSIALGRETEASALSSIALNGGKASAERSMAAGRNAKAELVGKYAYSGEADFGATSIYSQQGTYVLICPTTNATPVVLTTNNTTASAINQIILQNNSAYAFTGIIIARQQAAAGNDFAAWEIKGGIVRGAGAGTTALGTYNINVLSKSAGAVTWTIALSADTANGGLAITVTGAAAVNIRWVATVQTSEVTYA